MHGLLATVWLFAAAQALADETAPPADRWRFGIGVAADWSEALADARSTADGLVIIPGFGGCGCVVTGVGAATGEVQPNGFGFDPSARVWFPVSLVGGQPWLEAGYRQPFSNTRDDELQVPDIRTIGGFAAVFSLRPKRTASVRLGMDWSLPVPKLPVLVAPVFGADFSWFESRVAYRSRDIDDTQTDFFAGLVGGLELRLPLHRGPAHSVELALSGTYTGYLGGERTIGAGELAPIFPDFEGASASYDLDGVYAVRFGVLASFW